MMALDPKAQEGMDLDNPQMPLHSPTEPEKEKPKDVDDFGLKYSEIPSWSELTGEPHFKIGIVINSCTTNDRHISAIYRPASMCSVGSLVVLHPQIDENKTESMHKWLESNRLEKFEQDITIRWGQEGFEELLKSQIDAVYISVPPG
jgi:hypothetical protein